MKKSFLLLTGAFLFFTSAVIGQFLEAPALQHYFDFSAEDTNKILFDFFDDNFIKDTEYFGPIASGMTLLGDDINAQLGWVPDKHILILGGVFARKDYGTPGFEILQPTWTVKLQDNKGISFLIGNIEGAMDHRYIQPIFQSLFPVSYYQEPYQNPLETGGQLKIDKPWLWFDLWINWQHQEYLNSDYHEHILQGASADLTLLHPNDVLKISLPLQYTFFHYGGQLDTAHTPYETIYNGAAGLKFNFDFSKNSSFIKDVMLEGYACAYKDLSRVSDIQLPYISGNGEYVNVDIKTKYGFGIDGSFWNGSDWVAPLGLDLYQSVSWVYKSYSEDSRKLIFLRLYYQKELLPNLYVDLRLEPYTDLNLKLTEYAYYIFLTYKRTFTLAKVHLPKFNDNAYSH